MTEDGMAGWHHGLDGHESEWTPGDGDGQGGLVCCDSWGRKESDTTERLNWTGLEWGYGCSFNFIDCSCFLWIADILLPGRSFLYVLNTSHFSDVWLANIFPHFMFCIFTFLMVSFEAQKFLILMESNLLAEFFIDHCVLVLFLWVVLDSLIAQSV